MQHYKVQKVEASVLESLQCDCCGRRTDASEVDELQEYLHRFPKKKAAAMKKYHEVHEVRFEADTPLSRELVKNILFLSDSVRYL